MKPGSPEKMKRKIGDRRVARASRPRVLRASRPHTHAFVAPVSWHLQAGPRPGVPARGETPLATRGRDARATRGFTLIEILATLTLLAVVLPTAMSGISLSLATSGFAKQQAQASSLAYGKMNELAAQGQLDQAILSGDFSPEHPEFRWTAQVQDWDGNTLRQLDVRVMWYHRQQERSVALSTLVNVPLTTAGVTP